MIEIARLPLVPLVFSLVIACSNSGGTTTAGGDSDSDGTTSSGGTTASSDGSSTSSSDGTTSQPGTTSTTGTTSQPGTSSQPGTTDATTGGMTTDPSTTMADTSGTTMGDSDTATTGEEELLECLSGEIMEKAGANVMEFYGAPCMADDDCVPLIGPDAICIPNILEVYDAPGGYCTRPCEQPDDETLESPNHAGCKAGGTASCIGVNGLFTACAFPCTSSDQCHREGYVCRTVPLVNSEQKYCLMPDACCIAEDGCDF